MAHTITIELPDDANLVAYRHIHRPLSSAEILALIGLAVRSKRWPKPNADWRKYIYNSPKSKEGCRVIKRQQRKLDILVLCRRTQLKTYYMLKRLILLSP